MLINCSQYALPVTTFVVHAFGDKNNKVPLTSVWNENTLCALETSLQMPLGLIKKNNEKISRISSIKLEDFTCLFVYL